MTQGSSSSRSFDEPPPYVKDAHPIEAVELDNLEAPAIVEELPVYTADTHLPSRVGGFVKLPPRRKWWIIPLILFVVVAAIVGGVIGNNHRDKQQAVASKDPSSPIITALTATECDAGNFVFYQVNTSEIYLHGHLWGGYWNETLSTEIPSTSLHLTETNLRPYYGSNLTAVCYNSRNETLNEDIIVLRLFYTAMPLIFDFPLVEATISIPLTQFQPGYLNSIIPLTQQVIANISNPASLSACYIEDWGLGLYYLDAPSSSGTPNITPATITQLYWNETSLWSNHSTPLDAKAFNSGAAFSVVCITDPRVPPETHVLYMDEDNVLAQLSFTNDTWSPASVVRNIDNKGALSGISNMVVTAPYINPTNLYLYYLDGYRPQIVIIVIDESSYLNGLTQTPASPAAFPDAINAPDLIAATARLDGFEGEPQMSVFYVWRSNATSGTDYPQGSVILNMTDVTDGWVEDSWNVDGLL